MKRAIRNSIAFQALVNRTIAFEQRTYDLAFYDRILFNRTYEDLKKEFHEQGNGKEYVPLHKRAPCIKNNICKLVVDDSTSLLFSESHFPKITCSCPKARVILEKVMKEMGFNELFLDCAFKGSIGSVALLVGVLPHHDLEGCELFIKVLKTIFLTPEYENDKCKHLKRIIELYKTDGFSLKKSGYMLDEKFQDKGDVYWFRRVWDRTDESYFVPIRQDHLSGKLWISEDKQLDISDVHNESTWTIDKERSVTHDLGFVPIIWIQNLPGGDNNIDGQCTFSEGIDNMICKDYLLSQGDRGLKYSAEPVLTIQSDEIMDAGDGSSGTLGGTASPPQVNKSRSNVLLLPQDAQAKLLEITGNGLTTLMDFAKMERESSLEVMHGNRMETQKLSVAQSGKAMEMMNQALVWLADKLRVTYGEGALRKLLRLILKLVSKYDIYLEDELLSKDFDKNTSIELVWGNWFPYTPDDLQKESVALVNLVNNGLLSRETAVKSIESNYNIDDTAEEIKRIDIELKDKSEVENANMETQEQNKSLPEGDKKVL
jgi:hypothetical protein